MYNWMRFLVFFSLFSDLLNNFMVCAKWLGMNTIVKINT